MDNFLEIDVQLTTSDYYVLFTNGGHYSTYVEKLHIKFSVSETCRCTVMKDWIFSVVVAPKELSLLLLFSPPVPGGILGPGITRNEGYE